MPIWSLISSGGAGFPPMPVFQSISGFARVSCVTTTALGERGRRRVLQAC
eukprot:CAMPEP_0180764956 /NCGR_PEP_ID=MMETSP1038_2-20121128/38724_1 /TAXON_ID=632150 /ORGANISM="Azadinium spinosum, Strain 3D9" /LENGTH=49 /DNA_ID= /DNA_START= /DNA_END= /DNA_ORIENTATION=